MAPSPAWRATFKEDDTNDASAPIGPAMNKRPRIIKTSENRAVKETRVTLKLRGRFWPADAFEQQLENAWQTWVRNPDSCETILKSHKTSNAYNTKKAILKLTRRLIRVRCRSNLRISGRQIYKEFELREQLYDSQPPVFMACNLHYKLVGFWSFVSKTQTWGLKSAEQMRLL